MNIYIPSRGRWAPKYIAGAYTPMRWLTKELRQRAFYCVRHDEVDHYAKALGGTGVRILDMEDAPTLGAKREIIAEHCQAHGEEKFMMCDDDVMLYVRKTPHEFNLRYPEPGEVNRLFNDIEEFLDEYAMVGISPREGNNRAGPGHYPMIHECTRSMRIYAFRTADYCSIEANRLKEMADFDTVLQFLRSGRKNAVLYYWANGQPTSNMPGGCSVYRTVQSHENVCHELAKLHPGFVSLRQKKNKGDQHGFGTRTEVTIQWKKAYESSQSQSRAA